ncbi:OmpA family protein [Desulfurobacterium crinifex]
MKRVVVLAVGVMLLLIGFVLVGKFGEEKRKSSAQVQKTVKHHKPSVFRSEKQGNESISKSTVEVRSGDVRLSREKEKKGKQFIQLRINNLQGQLEKVAFSSVENLDTEKIFRLVRNLSGKIVFKDGKLTVYLFAPPDTKISEDKLKKIVFNIKRKTKSGNIIVLADNGSLRVITVYSSNLSKSLTPDQIAQLLPSGNLLTFSSSRKIRFCFDKTEVIAEDKPNIDKVLSDLEFAIKKSGAKVSKIIIEGHTDSIGSEEYNLALSLRRAQILNDKLRKSFKNVFIVNIGKGEKFPIDTNDTPEGRKNNRRIGVSLEFSL